MVAAVRVAVGVERGGGEAMHAVREDAEEAQVSIPLILHPAEIVFEILLHASVSESDEAQIHQPVVAIFELLSGSLRADGEHNY